MKRLIVIVALSLVAGACGSAAPTTSTVAPAETPTTTSTPPSTTTTLAPIVADEGAPWFGPSLAAGEVDPVLVEQWSNADNRGWCSALFPADVNTVAAESRIRAANFGGGWAVAWDRDTGPGRQPNGEYCPDCGRGAFGIAGALLRAVGDEASAGPGAVSWADGSIGEFAPEGGVDALEGAPLLMTLLISGEGCVYNVWSFLGEEHLLSLTRDLRFVDTLRGEPTLWLNELPPTDVVSLGSPPWSEAPLSRSALPEAAYLEWEGEAGAPAGCPLLFFADLGAAEGASIRRAANEGEMLVAWDLPSGPGHEGSGEPCEDCGRGVIGLGTFQNSIRGSGLPAAYEWVDGSIGWTFAETYSYGVEATVKVADFDCSYWLWSHLGKEHLEYLMGQLRRVEGLP